METMVKAYQNKLMSVMPQVKQYGTKLKNLNDWWNKITLIGKINSHNLASFIFDDMQETKDKFSELHNKLINNLLLENLQKVIVDNTAKSQVTIDILIRNLFERTADVGFLATDNDIRAFLAAHDSGNNTQSLIEERLSEYVKKYSVYDEIILLDLQGNVRAHLDQNNPISISHDALIKETLNTTAEYVEVFRYCDLQPQKDNSLIYSCKITTSNEPNSTVLGVLCLSFNFEDEITSIFNNLSDNGNTRILLMSEQGNVIASSDPKHVPLNTRFQFNHSPQLVTYQNCEYLVSCTRTQGYQGYYGLGWWAMIMTPIKSAFQQAGDGAVELLNCSEYLDSSELFPHALKEIYQTSIVVKDDLSLLVLNGQITASKQKAAEFMPVLEAIKEIGANTATIFSDSINNLQETVVSSQMNDVAFMAALSVNIMDRNLYERANDCRWWAQTSAFRQILAQPRIDADDLQTLSNILHYINELYTVYTNLYLFDNSGHIIAVSNPTQKAFISQCVNEQTGAKEALTLKNSQQYSVSAFEPTVLYENRHTYIYNAVITSIETEQVLGGIGIIFDSEPEFTAMLVDTLPKDDHGYIVKGCFALFAERTGKIIAVTDQSPLIVGEKLSLDPHLFTIQLGEKHSEIYRFQGVDYILGIAASSGYREYKIKDDYKNDILSFIFIPI